MSKHSEGPWEVCVDPPNPQWFAGVTVGNKHHRICDVSQLGPTQGEVAEANGRLIAAAPDLLEVVDSCIKWYGNRNPDNDELWPYDNQPPEIQRAMDVIAKVKGNNNG
jgi:hypothetical protein